MNSEMSESLGTCPSGDVTAAEAMVFAVVGNSETRPLLRYLDKPVPIDIVRSAGVDDRSISQGMRVASTCAGGRCKHYEPGLSICNLAAAVRTQVPTVVDKPPPCAVRKDCVWWKQEGVAACLRCPTVTQLRIHET